MTEVKEVKEVREVKGRMPQVSGTFVTILKNVCPDIKNIRPQQAVRTHEDIIRRTNINIR